ncbi:TetR/AcrR family transcriptional regulator [Tardiphaga sp.]|uniref:TetR/AcrR family transcriptional regulator n=1 Tax=Tardiphaga sp. TaxID=1926292 RepID=UPI0025EB8CC3|nr:TetR/AcrR family transcriptional regulator [Tardiphaga sp.]
MSKSDDRRAVILDALADHVLAQGLAGSSLRPLAQAAGISDRMLLYYFTDKAELVAAVLATIAVRLTAMLEAAAAPPMPVDEVRARLVGILMGDTVWPYMRVWLEMASLASQEDATGNGRVFSTAGEAIGRGFYAWGLAQITADTPEARAIDAARLLVTIEGMMLLKSVGMSDIARMAI